MPNSLFNKSGSCLGPWYSDVQQVALNSSLNRKETLLKANLLLICKMVMSMIL